MSESYPWPLCKRLLEAWPDLAAGRWPADPNAPDGYKGQPSADGGFEAAVIAAVDLEDAVAALPQVLGREVRRRYWEGGSRRQGDPPWLLLVDAVHAMINR